jgi:peptide/nickel transport system permease protein
VTLELAQEEFVLAARARGDGPVYILMREILPNAWPPIAVEGSLRITFAILLGAALSFLGLGAQPPSLTGPHDQRGPRVRRTRAVIALAPGIAMCVTVIGVNLLGDGLREVLDPRMRSGKGS